MTRSVPISFLLFTVWCSLTAQEVPPLVGPLVDSSLAALRFERNVNTYLWNALGAYRYQDRRFSMTMKEQFTSSFIRGQYGSYRDEQSVSFGLQHALDGPYTAVFDLQSFLLSDQQAFGSSNAGIHSAAAGVAIRPAPNVSITPMAGVRSDQQLQRTDQGWNLRLLGRADSLDAGEYRAAMSGQFNESDLGKRRFKNDGLLVNIASDFSSVSSDSLRVHWSLNRNDFYIPADSIVLRQFGSSSNIRSRSEDQWGLQNTLNYAFGDGLVGSMEVEAESRTITNAFAYKPLAVLSAIPFNTEVQEFRIQAGWLLGYDADGMHARVGFRLGERTEKHRIERIDGVDEQYQSSRARDESRLDNSAYRTALTADVIALLSASDALGFSGSVSLLQYDTPDTINTDDRDELLVTLQVTERHQFGPTFHGAFTLEATAAHLVYLSSKKSANNSWNRILRLKPELTYQPSERFRMFNAFEVLANYTVFDFESIIPSVKSYSYRQVAFLDSTSYDMTNRIGADVTAFIRVYERGELHWVDFAERPLQRIEEVTVSPQLRYTSDDRWTFTAGFRSFVQKRYTYTDGKRGFDNTFISAGPTASIGVTLSSASLVEVRGWKEFQRLSGGAIKEYSNMTMNVRYRF